jgi:hypothetical protein
VTARKLIWQEPAAVLAAAAAALAVISSASARVQTVGHTGAAVAHLPRACVIFTNAQIANATGDAVSAHLATGIAGGSGAGVCQWFGPGSQRLAELDIEPPIPGLPGTPKDVLWTNFRSEHWQPIWPPCTKGMGYFDPASPGGPESFRCQWHGYEIDIDLLSPSRAAGMGLLRNAIAAVRRVEG